MSFKIETAMRAIANSTTHAPWWIGYTLAAWCIVMGTGLLPAAASQPTAEPAGRRVLALLSAVAEEYRESLDENGTLVRPMEFAEARSFLAEAQTRWSAVPAGAEQAPITAALAALAAALDAHAPAADVRDRVAALRTRIATATGVEDTPRPPGPPSPSRGAAVFASHCVSCHGARGDGQGAAAAALARRPPNFTDPAFMRNETPSDFFHVVTLGRGAGAMPAWGERLSEEARWDVVSFLWQLARPQTAILEGQGLYVTHCAGCHGVAGDGRGPYADALLTTVPVLVDRLGQQSDADLFGVVRDGKAGTPMPAFRSLSDDETWKVVAFLRALSLGGLPAASREPTTASAPATGQPIPSLTRPEADVEARLDQVQRGIDAAVLAYRAADPDALGKLTDAYFSFEPLEVRLGATRPDLKDRVEAGFIALRGTLGEGGNERKVGALAARLATDLDSVRDALAGGTSRYAVVAQAAAIILREGFEVVLLVGALLAYVARIGASGLRSALHAGTALGVGASVLTALALGELLRVYPGSPELIEGVSMLLAAVVLFWVSYWLISKAEADRWQAFIRGQVHAAVVGRRRWALAGVAFLAVYREGVETVLFYQALSASPGSSPGSVGLGIAVGGTALTLFAVAWRRWQFRLPLPRFFAVTGTMLYVMAVVFAGQGVHELQEVGVVGVTPVVGAPSVDWLGVFPTVETLGSQGVLLALAGYASLVLSRRRNAVVSGGPAVARGTAPLEEQP